MKAVLQRVSHASVCVEGKIVGQIESGLAILLGVMEGDTPEQADFLAKKACELRIFTDENDKMNLSVRDVGGEILVISQFTLAADCSHGRRPAFIRAARPEQAIPLYERFVEAIRQSGITVATGEFGAHMEFALTNDGPVTILFDTDEMMTKG